MKSFPALKTTDELIRSWPSVASKKMTYAQRVHALVAHAYSLEAEIERLRHDLQRAMANHNADINK